MSTYIIISGSNNYKEPAFLFPLVGSFLGCAPYNVVGLGFKATPPSVKFDVQYTGENEEAAKMLVKLEHGLRSNAEGECQLFPWSGRS
jgi:hypothetical protein